MTSINLGSKLGENLIINPLFDLWQRGTSFLNIGSGVYGADRFRTSTTSAIMKIDVNQSSDVPANSKANYSSKLTLNSAPAVIGADDFYTYLQQIEGYNARKIYDKRAYFKCYVKSNTTGFFAFNIGTSLGDQRFVSKVNIPTANVWTEIKIPVKKIETALGGTFKKNSDAGLYVAIVLSAGTTAIAPVEDEWFLDSSASLGITNQIDFGNTAGIELLTTQWQLHEGLDEIPFENIMRDFGSELELCQRYFENVGAFKFCDATYPSQQPHDTVWFKTEKRDIPVNVYSVTNEFNAGANWLVNNGVNHVDLVVAGLNGNLNQVRAQVNSWTADSEL
jgi:hypothetical protein